MQQHNFNNVTHAILELGDAATSIDLHPAGSYYSSMAILERFFPILPDRDLGLIGLGGCKILFGADEQTSPQSA